MAQPDFVDAYIAHRTCRSSETVDEENAHARQSLKCFSRPFLYQLGRNHDEGREWLAVTMNVDSAERNQCLASPTLRDYRCSPCFIPAFYHAHHGERLCGKRPTEELRYQRRSHVVKAVQRRIGPQNPLAQFGGPRTQVFVDVFR